ncbi:hypothetical protein QTP88_005762 [Uroleucon formosanum]
MLLNHADNNTLKHKPIYIYWRSKLFYDHCFNSGLCSIEQKIHSTTLNLKKIKNDLPRAIKLQLKCKINISTLYGSVPGIHYLMKTEINWKTT